MTMPPDKLPAFADDGHVRVVVESPRDSTVKLAYEPEFGTFTLRRALPAGLAYPYDWGFIPGTKAEDGDPVDALVLHDAATYPGVVLNCKPLGMLIVEEDSDDGPERKRNNRVILQPSWESRLGPFDEVTDVPERLRAEIEQFFLNATFFTSKNATSGGWQDRAATLAFIRSCVRS